MKWLVYISVFICLSANAQSLQLHGKFLNRESDTVRVQVWSDGESIVDKLTTDPFYAIILGDRKHYTIKTTSGSKEKYCTLICHWMEFESIQVDVDFASRQSVIIYKQRRGLKLLTFIFYGSGNTRSRDIKIYETN